MIGMVAYARDAAKPTKTQKRVISGAITAVALGAVRICTTGYMRIRPITGLIQELAQYAVQTTIGDHIVIIRIGACGYETFQTGVYTRRFKNLDFS